MRDVDRQSTSDRTPEGIKLHRPEDFEGMRRAGRLAAETLDMIAPYVKPGVTIGDAVPVSGEHAQGA